MITQEQALKSDELHFSNWHSLDGKCQRLRRHGKTRLPKDVDNDFIFPGIWGTHDYRHVDPSNAHLFHAPEDCPLNIMEK